MSGRTYTTTSISYGPRTSSSSISSQSSNGSRGPAYDNYSPYSRETYRVPVEESQARYSNNDRVYSVTRNGVSVVNHKKRIIDTSEPRSSDAAQSNYHRSSSHRK